jgi:inner membrane protein COX18
MIWPCICQAGSNKLFILFQTSPNHSLPPTSLTLRRHFSETPVAEHTSDYLPISLAQSFLESVHSYTNLPWWCTIVLTCVGLRSAITLPLAVYQNKLITKIELLQPTLKELTEALKHRVTIESRNKGLSSQAANKVFKKQVNTGCSKKSPL